MKKKRGALDAGRGFEVSVCLRMLDLADAEKARARPKPGYIEKKRGALDAGQGFKVRVCLRMLDSADAEKGEIMGAPSYQ